jgi:NAD-dependent dihydropyrimidine dehydrogenase PreA subunit
MTHKRYRRKAYWNRPTMGWWERLYLPEILRGLGITSRVFLRNMGKWMTGRKGALTTYYPEERRRDYARHNRGKHVLTQRPDGSPQCIACNMCATVCPAKVIEIEAAFDPDDFAHPKYPAASRSTTRAACSAGCASRPAPRTRSAWCPRCRTCLPAGASRCGSARKSC